MKQQLPQLGIWLGKAQSLVICILLLGTLIAPAIIQLSGWSTDPSFIDNRTPAPIPRLPNSLSEIGGFRDGIVKFVGDNFGLRAELVKLNVLLNSWIGVSSIPSLIVGKNGWIFLKTDFAVFDQFRGLNRFADTELDSWFETMERYRAWLAGQGIAFMVVIAPNQQTIYPEFMPGYANRVWPETRLDQLTRRLRERQSDLMLIDLRPDLWAARKDKVLLYHQYENHWNAMGSFVGYSSIMQRVEKLFPDVKTLHLSDFTAGTLARSWNFPPKTEIEPTLSLKTSSNVAGSEIIATVNGTDFFKITSRLERAPSVLIYGDSFAGALIPYFKETFSSTIFVATAQATFPAEMIQRHRPNLVIFELVERYLAAVPSDNLVLESDMLIGSAPPLRKMLDETEGPVGGYVDAAQLEGGEVRFSGWAIDGAAKAPAKVVFAYAGDHVIGAAKPNHARPDLTQGMLDGTVGFQIKVPNNVNIQPPNQLRFFSINPGNRIYELKIYSPILPQIDEIFRVKNSE